MGEKAAQARPAIDVVTDHFTESVEEEVLFSKSALYVQCVRTLKIRQQSSISFLNILNELTKYLNIFECWNQKAFLFWILIEFTRKQKEKTEPTTIGSIVTEKLLKKLMTRKKNYQDQQKSLVCQMNWPNASLTSVWLSQKILRFDSFSFSPHFPRTSLVLFLSFRSLFDLVVLSFHRPENKIR